MTPKNHKKNAIGFSIIFIILILCIGFILLAFSAFEAMKLNGKERIGDLFADHVVSFLPRLYIMLTGLFAFTFIILRAFYTSRNRVHYRKILYFILFWAFIAQNIFPLIPILILALFFGVSSKDFMLLATNPGAFPLDYLLFIGIFVLLGTVFSFYIFRKKFEKRTLENFGYPFAGNFIRQAFFGLLVGGLFIGSGFAMLYFTGNITIESIRFELSQQILYILFFLVMAANEEIILRAYILDKLLETGNKFKALLVSAVIFAVLHSFNPNITWLSFLNLIIAGFFLGISYIHVRNIWFPTLLHFSWNYFQGPIFGFGVSGMHVNGFIEHKITGNTLITGGEFGLEGSIVASVLMIIFVAAIHFYYTRKSPLTQKA